MSEKAIIPWIGFRWEDTSYKNKLEKDLGVTIDTTPQTLEQGVAHTQKKVPLIFIEEVLAPGPNPKYKTFGGANIEQSSYYEDLSIKLIEHIKNKDSVNTKTPIIVFCRHSGNYSQANQYIESGANGVVDSIQGYKAVYKDISQILYK